MIAFCFLLCLNHHWILLSSCVHLSGATHSAYVCSQLPTQLVSSGLECQDLSLSGFQDSHLTFSVFSPFKDEAEISCVQLFFKHICHLPFTTKMCSFSNFLFSYFFLACPSHLLLRPRTADHVHPNSPLTAARARAVVYDPYSSGRPVQVGTTYRISPSQTGCVHCTAMPLRIWLAIFFIAVFLSEGSSTVCWKVDIKRLEYKSTMVSNLAKKSRGPWYLHNLLQDFLVDIEVAKLLAK